MAKFTDLFDKDDQAQAKKYLDYYDGDQKEYVIAELKRIRANTFRTGMLAPRFRNIVKMIVDKSGMLFNGNAPKLEVFTNAGLDENQSQSIQELFETADWVEFFTNVDPMTRMLKTSIVLPYFMSQDNKLSLTFLGPHNCGVAYDEMTKTATTLIYCTGKTPEGETFRVISNEFYQDILVTNLGEEVIQDIQPNPYGFIPPVPFHDTNTPREGYFNEIDETLIDINDIYNIALSDSEYSASWAKLETLFTNCEVEGSDNGAGSMVETQHYGEALPRMMPSMGNAAIGGPGKIIKLESNGINNPFVEYKGPKPDLQPLDDMVNKWVSDFAADWSVNASMDNSSADSGFKLVVREMPNLELRKKRQKMFEAGFKRLFKSIKQMVNFSKPGTFSDDAELFVKFSAPELPFDEKVSEEIWSRKIAEKRASRTDYFMAVQGLSKEEALAKIVEIDAEQPIAQNKPVVSSIKNTTVSV